MEYWEWKNVFNRDTDVQDSVYISSQRGVAIYDQETLTDWTRGTLTLTSHELIYTAENNCDSATDKIEKANVGVKLKSGKIGSSDGGDAAHSSAENKSSNCTMSIALSLQVISDTLQRPSYVKGSVFKSDKIIIPLPASKYVKLSFREGGVKIFYENLINALNRKTWQTQRVSVQAKTLLPSSSAPVSSSLMKELSLSTAQESSKSNVNIANTYKYETKKDEHNSLPLNVPVRSHVANVINSGNDDNHNDNNNNKLEVNELHQKRQQQQQQQQRPMLGIAGVMYAAQQNAKLTETLASIDDVMSKASAIVNGVRLLKQKQQMNAQDNDESEADKLALESIEETLGLGTLVTRSEKKSKNSYFTSPPPPPPSSLLFSSDPTSRKCNSFHAQLGAELHGWMTHPRNAHLFTEMAIIPLIELFALYNKARSGDLVSPDDVLAACKVISGKTNSQYTLQTLASGRKALVHKNNSFILLKLSSLLGPQFVNSKQVSNNESSKIHELTNANAHTSTNTMIVPTTSVFPSTQSELRSVNEVEAANLLKVAVPVARDVLCKLENDGYLCRSDGRFGCITFYWNIFVL